jgi:hypothetical protein
MHDKKNDNNRRDGDGDNNENDYNDVDDSNEVVNKLELSFCEFIDTQQLCYNNKGILIDFKTTIHTVKEAYSSIMDDVDDMNQFDMKQLINQLIIFADNFSNEFESAYIVDSVVELIFVLVKYDLIIISLGIIPIITVKSIQNSMNTCKSNNINSNKTNNPHNSSSSSSSISFLASVSSASTTSIIDDDSYITIDATTDIHSSLRCRDWYSQLFRWDHHQKTVTNHNIASIVNTSNTRVNDISMNTGANVTTTTPTTTTTNTVSGGMMIKKESSSVKRNSVVVKVIIVVFVELSSRCSVSMFVCVYIFISM